MKPEPTSDIDLAIPSALVAEIRAAADDEHRPAAELVREALERYLADWRKATSLADRGRTPSKRTPAEAAARLRELREGNVLPDGISLRDLMTHGRA
jgi:hypothetical protein